MESIKSIIIDLFGSYEPVLSSDGDVLPGLAGWDMPYIVGVLLFALFLYCVMRIIGGILNGK